MAWPSTLSNLRTDIVAGMSRAGVEAAEFVKHAVAINNLESNASPNTHTHTVTLAAANFSAPAAGDFVTAARTPVAATPTAFWARRKGGTGAVVDVKKNGTSLLTGTLSITTADTWTAGTLVATPSLAAGDVVEFDVVSVAGGPTEIVVQLDGTH